MSLSEYYYGKENPSPIRKLATHSMMCSLALCAYGWWADFIPSSDWMHQGFYLSIVSAVVMTVFLYWGYGTGRLEMNRGSSKPNKICALIILPFFIFGFFWLILIHGLADLITLSIGSFHRETVILVKEHSVSRRSCHYRLNGEALNRALPNYICVSGSFYDALPAGSVSITLEGKSTFFGFHIQRIYHNNANPAPNQESLSNSGAPIN